LPPLEEASAPLLDIALLLKGFSSSDGQKNMHFFYEMQRQDGNWHDNEGINDGRAQPGSLPLHKRLSIF